MFGDTLQEHLVDSPLVVADSMVPVVLHIWGGNQSSMSVGTGLLGNVTRSNFLAMMRLCDDREKLQ